MSDGPVAVSVLSRRMSGFDPSDFGFADIAHRCRYDKIVSDNRGHTSLEL